MTDLERLEKALDKALQLRELSDIYFAVLWIRIQVLRRMLNEMLKLWR